MASERIRQISDRHAAFSPDGKLIACGCADGTVKVWNATTGEESLTLKGHSSAVVSVAFSPDGKRIASASVDQTVKLWDVATAQETLTLKGHSAPVASVVFSPDGDRLASFDGDGMVRVWDARPLHVEPTFAGIVRAQR
jgi:WD40 repeat protein